MERPKYVLVTGATGFIGAHIVDELLRRGFRVRGSTRTLAKGKEMIKTREQYADKLDFIEVGDFENTNVFDERMEGIDGIIHVASPFTYDVKDNERELIRPAKNGVHAIMSAAEAQPNIKRIVITSSFAAVLNADRKAPPYFDYTSDDCNPLTEEEACIPGTSPVIAYRAAKKYAELVAWDWIRAIDEGKSRHFDLVTLCPPMTFGPVVHPVSGVSKLNESNAMLWKIAKDLAVAHVEALLRPEAGGKRYLLGANDRFSYGLAAKIMADNFDWARDTVAQEEQVIDTSHGLENKTAAKELGLNYRTFDQTVVDLVTQARKMDIEETKS
ncbi:hypothetical protein COL940_013576 [Colletotrichum noveboracense]|nr:hypothetical protein COL940_013576 [Colletotrichum noveboracense]